MLLLLQKRENEKIQFRIFYRKGPSGRDKYLVSTAAKAINFNAFWTAWIHTCATLFEIRTKNVSLTCGSGSWDWPFCRRFDPFVNDYITWRCRWRTVGNSFCKNRKKWSLPLPPPSQSWLFRMHFAKYVNDSKKSAAAVHAAAVLKYRSSRVA